MFQTTLTLQSNSPVNHLQDPYTPQGAPFRRTSLNLSDPNHGGAPNTQELRQNQRDRILAALLCSPTPMTDDQLQEATHIPYSSIRFRINELRSSQLINIVGTGLSKQGHKCRTLNIGRTGCIDGATLGGSEKSVGYQPTADPPKTPQ